MPTLTVRDNSMKTFNRLKRFYEAERDISISKYDMFQHILNEYNSHRIDCTGNKNKGESGS